MSETAPADPSHVITAGGRRASPSMPRTPRRVHVCLFDDAASMRRLRVTLTRDSDGRSARLRAGLRRRARATACASTGRSSRRTAIASTPSKLLADPYAGRVRPAVHAASLDVRARRDSGPFAPKCVSCAPPGGEPGAQRVAPEDTDHLRTQPARLLAAAPGHSRGCARDASPRSPRRRVDRASDVARRHHRRDHAGGRLRRRAPPAARSGSRNAWGYNPVVFGRARSAARAGRLARRCARATDALHAAGLEVVLDVVLNHNGESDEFGPTLSFRGLDNAAYFRLPPDDLSRYINDMGTGNCVALDRPHVVAHGDRRAEALDGLGRHRRLPLRSRDRARPPRRGL